MLRVKNSLDRLPYLQCTYNTIACSFCQISNEVKAITNIAIFFCTAFQKLGPLHALISLTAAIAVAWLHRPLTPMKYVHTFVWIDFSVHCIYTNSVILISFALEVSTWKLNCNHSYIMCKCILRAIL